MRSVEGAPIAGAVSTTDQGLQLLDDPALEHARSELHVSVCPGHPRLEPRFQHALERSQIHARVFRHGAHESYEAFVSHSGSVTEFDDAKVILYPGVASQPSRLS